MLDSRLRKWDDTCPGCGKKLDLRDHWNYETEFETECQHCECNLHVIVETAPEFGVMTKEKHDRLEKEYYQKIASRDNETQDHPTDD